MTFCHRRGPFGYHCTRERGHASPCQATTQMGRKEVVLDSWTEKEIEAFHKPTIKTEIPLQIRRSGTWRPPLPGEIQQVLQEGHQVTIRRTPA